MQNSRGIIRLFLFGFLAAICLYMSPKTQNLEVAGYYYFPDYEVARSIYVDRNYAYVARHGEGIYIIDISDLSDPFIAAIYDTTGVTFEDVVVQKNMAYLAVSGIGIMILDVTIPTYPVLLGHSQFNRTGAHAVFVNQNLAYLAHCNRGITIFDVSDPHNPTVIGICYTTYYIAHDVIVSGQYAYAVDFNNGLTIADVSDPTDPFATGSYYMPHCNSHLAILPNIAYLLSFYGDLVIIDTSDPFNPSYISEFSLDPIGSQDIKISNNKAYIAGEGIAILDLTDPTNPIMLEQYDENMGFTAIFVRNDLIFLGGAHWFYIFRYNSPTGFESISELPDAMHNLYSSPNPFNSSTTISFRMTEPNIVNLSIYNIQGQRVVDLFHGRRETGEHSVVWDASEHPSGVYFARLEARGASKTAKMVLLK